MRLLNGGAHSNTAVLALLVMVLPVRRKQGEKGYLYLHTSIIKLVRDKLKLMSNVCVDIVLLNLSKCKFSLMSIPI